jgi:T5SS/PEP-CTERM-associated repeat protein
MGTAETVLFGVGEITLTFFVRGWQSRTALSPLGVSPRATPDPLPARETANVQGSLAHCTHTKLTDPSLPAHLVMKKFDVAHLSVARSHYRSLAHWALLALFVTSMPAFAQTTVWTDATGDWFTSTNWSAGVPDSSTSAQINNGGTAQIMASGAAAFEVELGVAAGDAGTLSISGGGTLGPMNIGEFGTGTLNITAGGIVQDSEATIGSGSGSTGTAVIDGAGTTWTLDGGITIGDNAKATGTLTISSGATVISGIDGAGSVIGHNPTSSGTVNVSGAGSTWTNKALLTLGDAGGDGILNITGNGVVSNGDAALGASSGSGTVTVQGMGSTWTLSGDLSVGDVSGGIGTVTINQGGQVADSNGFIAAGSSSTGHVNIAGANATWSNSGNVYVGGNATGAVGAGELLLINNGMVSATALTVWSTGFLTGNGSVQAAGVTNQGTLAPNQIISINGDLTFGSTAIMSSTVTPATADSIMVQGMAGLDGNLNLTLTGGPFIVGMQYTLLTANGGLNGTAFSNVSITAPAGVTAQVTYDTNNVVLTIESSATPTPTPTGTPSPTPTVTVSPTPTPTVTVSPTPTPTVTVSPTPTATVTPTPTPTSTPRHTPTPRPVRTPRPRPTPPPRP